MRGLRVLWGKVLRRNIQPVGIALLFGSLLLSACFSTESIEENKLVHPMRTEIERIKPRLWKMTPEAGSLVLQEIVDKYIQPKMSFPEAIEILTDSGFSIQISRFSKKSKVYSPTEEIEDGDYLSSYLHLRKDWIATTSMEITLKPLVIGKFKEIQFINVTMYISTL